MKKISAIVLLCLMCIGWMVLEPDQQQVEAERIEAERDAQQRFEANTEASYQKKQSELVEGAELAIRSTLSHAGVRCLGVKEIEPGNLWLAVDDQEQNIDALAPGLCQSTRKHFFRSLTIVNVKDNSINTYKLQQEVQ